MDTLWRHKSFLLTTAFLLLTSYFTAREPMEPQTDAEVPVVGPELKAEPLSPKSSDLTMEQISTPTPGATPSQSTSATVGDIVPRPHLVASCVFCKIISGESPSFKVYETEHSLAFLALRPVAHGHTLIIPKHHSRTLTDPGLPDEYLADIGPIMAKIAVMNGEKEYNIIQNNGRTAWQSVDHVHFHVVPKPDDDHGLVLTHDSWPSFDLDPSQYAHDAEKMRNIGRDAGFPGVSDQDLSQYYGV